MFHLAEFYCCCCVIRRLNKSVLPWHFWTSSAKSSLGSPSVRTQLTLRGKGKPLRIASQVLKNLGTAFKILVQRMDRRNQISHLAEIQPF